MTNLQITTKDLLARIGLDETYKPRFRGWIHTVATPLASAATIVLVALAPTPGRRLASAIFFTTSLLLFGVSSLYHRFYWGPRMFTLLRRLDHANIFLLIAGTYTPLSVALLPPSQARTLLLVVWSGAALGIVGRVFFPWAPRWSYTPLYIALGWVALWYLPALLATGGWVIIIPIIVGGVAYTLGAIVYGFKRPDPFPKWFGFHEVFHAFTVIGWVCHCVAAFLAVLTVS